MLPKRFLHYEVVDKIFTSGMSEIYKVKNLKLAGRVEALKLLSEKHRKNKDVYIRFRKEAEILSSLNHRCIPVIYEINQFHNRPFITMEFVNGKSLLDITEYKILSMGRIIDIGTEVVSALKTAHSHGIIHRDLKLSNIMITRAGGVKIIDFGLSVTGWATPEKDKGFIIGTLPYMSPEQTRGEQLDHRTDIFSFGICLYELLSGRLPFFHPEPDEVLRRVQELIPRPIRELRPETPGILESCIFRCIEKDQRKRFQSLDELGEVLEEVENYLKERGERRPTTEAVRDRMEILSMDMVAREEEFSRLTQAYFRSISGKGTVVFIQGEAGIGKSRLIEELIKRLDISTVHVASGQAQPGMILPYRSVSEAIRYLLLARDVVTDQELNEFIDTHYGRSSVQGRILKSFLLHTASKNLEIAGRENLFDTVSDLLAGFARNTPLIMVLENMHWADKATLDLVLHLTGSIQGRKILLLVTFRPREPGRKSDLALKTFADVAGEKGKTGDAILLRLDRLNPTDTQHLVSYYFPGHHFDKNFLKRIYDESDGNPLFILELLKLFARLGAVTKTGKGWVQVKGKEDIPVPTRIHDLILRRLSSLSEKEMQVLEAGAVEGSSFNSESVGNLTHLDRLAVLNILRSLWHQQLIDLMGESYRFNPTLVREVIYRQMMPELKQEFHRVLAKLYLDTPPPGKGCPADVARHFHLGGDLEKAVNYYMEAGYDALSLYADREALQYFDSALALLEETPLGPGVKTALDIHLNRSEIFLRMGETEKSQAAAEEALSLANAMGVQDDLGRSLKVKGKICHLRGASEEAETCLEEALLCSNPPSDRAEILNLLGLTAENRGDHKTAMHRFSESLAISKTAGNRLRTAQTLNHMGRTHLNKGDTASALTQFRKALDITKEIGDRRGIAVNTNNVGLLLRRMDRLRDSLVLLFRAARIFKEIRYPHGAANTLWNMGKVFKAMGDRKKAEKFVLKARGIFEKIGSRQGAALCQHSLGDLYAANGELDSALEQIDLSVQTGKEISYPRIVAYGLASKGSLELVLGLVSEGKKSLLAAEEAARECEDLILTATIKGQLGLAECTAGAQEEGLSLVREALASAEASKDPGLLRDTHLLLCRAELMALNLPEAEKSFFKASSFVGRGARPSLKADLYFEAGLVDAHRKKPQPARRKFETALALQRGLNHPLKILECLHGLCATCSQGTTEERMSDLESEKEALIKRLGASISHTNRRKSFQRYHSRGGSLRFVVNSRAAPPPPP